MTLLHINGKEYRTDSTGKLIRFLRDELKLTSVKDGCSDGACGACTVLVDGHPVKSCVLPIPSLEGREIITTEGLSKWERKVIDFAFAESGAVQCGFCIPGMVICTKALLDTTLNPTEDEIKYALRNNWCRCTGYVKIMEAVKLAARIFRTGEFPTPESETFKVGERVQRIDAYEKTRGTGMYADDYYLPDMLHASVLRSKYPRARVVDIDTSKAEALEGIVAVYRAEDIPGQNKIGHIKHDQYSLIPVGGITHFIGDGIVLIAGESRQIVEKAKKLVKVKYEKLEAVTSIEQAARADAPRVFEEEKDNILAVRTVNRGDAAKAIANSDFVVNHRFTTPIQEHAFIEPETAVAFMDGEYVMVESSDQSAHTTLREVSLMLGTDKVKVRNPLIGGAFGGKEDLTVQHYAAMVTYLTKRPCKVKLTRQESLAYHPKRHASVIDVTVGCDKNGIIQGTKATLATDTGAFASLGGPVLERACTHLAGPYNYENFSITGTAYYTNNPPAGAFRGFGVTQSCFAIEGALNLLAEKVGISPLELRMRNAIRPSQALPNGQIVDESTGLVETLEAVKPYWDEAVKAHKPAGLACAFKNSGVGVGLPDWGRVKLIVGDDNKIHIQAGASCLGQGLGTVLTQMIGSSCPKLKADQIVYEHNNTWIAPDSGDSSGSRQTLVTGEALCRACRKLNEELDKGRTLSQMTGEVFYGEYLAKTDPLGTNKKNPVSHVAYGYATQMCVLDPISAKIDTIYAAHDVGVAVNPLSLEGQIEGGVIMSTGYALKETYGLKDGIPTRKFGTLRLMRAHEIPKVKAIIVEKEGLNVAKGAIGIGEITSIPTAPAIAEAYRMLDSKPRYSLPLTDTPYSVHTPDPVHRTAYVACSRDDCNLNCSFRCIGCKKCAEVCPAEAITFDEHNLARVDENLCIGCGQCAEVCPQHTISIHEKFNFIRVACSNLHRGKEALSVCSTSCIGCGACERICTAEAVKVVDNLARINEELCLSCGMCITVCPRQAIVDTRGIIHR